PWSEAAMALANAAMAREDVQLRLRTAGGVEVDRRLPLSRLAEDASQRQAMQGIGLVPRHQLLPAVVGQVEPGSAAWGVLAEGDTITAIDGLELDSFDQVGPRLQAIGGKPAMVEVERDGERLALEVTPQRHADPRGGEAYWALGIRPAAAALPPYDATLRHGPLASVPAALAETWNMTRASVAMIGRLLTG